MLISHKKNKLRVFDDAGNEIHGVRSVFVQATDAGMSEVVLYIPTKEVYVDGVRRTGDGVRAD